MQGSLPTPGTVGAAMRVNNNGMVLDRFRATARAAGATAPDITLYAVAAQLLACWSQPHRHYHTTGHLDDCLERTEHEPVVALAVWGHDAVYDPESDVNEERSALLMTELLNRCALPAPVIAEVARLIRLTAGHGVEPGDGLGALMVDADLAVLARDQPGYDEYVRAIRAEYAHVSDESWRVGRAAVLRGLLALPRLYVLHPQWERPARDNLARELSALMGE